MIQCICQKWTNCLQKMVILFFFYDIFLSPGCEPSLVVPYGVPIWSLLVLYLPLKNYFLISTYKRFFLIFDPFKIFISGRVDLRVCSSYGVQFDLFLSYTFPFKTFFELNLSAVFLVFLTRKFFRPRRMYLWTFF